MTFVSMLIKLNNNPVVQECLVPCIKATRQVKYLIDPFAKGLPIHRKILNLVISALVFVPTLGIVHSYLFYQKTKGRFHIIEKNNKQYHVKEAKYWKLFPGFTNFPDFDYKKPKVDMSGLKSLPESERKRLKEHCLSQMRESMKALESSIVDGVNTVIKNDDHPEVMDTVNTFSKRVLDVYEAYTLVQAEEGIPILPLHIGRMKASGFSHEEILGLTGVCGWYCKEVEGFKNELKTVGLTEKEANAVLYHLGECQFSLKSSQANRKSKSNAPVNTIFNKNKKVEELSAKFLNQLNKKPQFFEKIVSFNDRIKFAKTFSQEEKEQMKQDLAHFTLSDPKNQQLQQLCKDPTYRLLQEIGQRFEWRDHETGYVGSSLRLLNILQGKHDDSADDSLYRIKLFFAYGSKNMLNEILISPEMVDKVNAKLKEQGKDWQLDTKLISVFRDKFADHPIYALGVYAQQNNIGKKLRSWSSYEDYKKKQKLDPNHTFAEAERIAQGIDSSPEELTKRFRLKLYPTEEMAFFGTDSNIEAQEMKRRKLIAEQYLEDQKGKETVFPSSSSEQAAPVTHFGESVLDYQKKDRPIHWTPGKHFFDLHTKEYSKSPYFDAIDDLGLAQFASVSGSTEQTITMAGVVGLQSKEDLMALRLAYLPWMSQNEDHSTHEILWALKSYGLEYTPAADYYNQLYPGSKPLVDAIKEAQHKRGYELPDYYLTNEYVKKFMEDEQNQKVQDLMAKQQLFLKGVRTYKENYSLKDLFGNRKWKLQTLELKKSVINLVALKRFSKRAFRRMGFGCFNRKVKYELNPKTKLYEPHRTSKKSIYKGAKKASVSIVPPSGKIIPYVPFDWPHLNRVGLLFDVNKSEFKEDKYVFSADANVDLAQKWKKYYTKKETRSPDFQEKLKKDSAEAYQFNREKAHQVTLKELGNQFELFGDDFIHYNEVLASLKADGIVGVFCFSRGLPTPIPEAKIQKEPKDYHPKFDYKPLEHESVVNYTDDPDYDRYMRLMGIAKKLAVLDSFKIDVPLYEINTTTDTGLSLLPRTEQIKEIKAVLENKNGELDGIVRIIKHQTNIKAKDKAIKEKLQATLKGYLKKL